MLACSLAVTRSVAVSSRAARTAPSSASLASRAPAAGPARAAPRRVAPVHRPTAALSSPSSSSSSSPSRTTAPTAALVRPMLLRPVAVAPVSRRSFATQSAENADSATTSEWAEPAEAETKTESTTDAPDSSAAGAEYWGSSGSATNGAKTEAPTLQRMIELEKSLAEKTEKVQLLTEQVQSALATVQNVQRMAKQDVENAKSYGIQKFAVDLLDVHDNLQRALKSVPEASRDHEDVKTLYHGLELTARILGKTLDTVEIKELNPTGEKFDTKFHDAIFQVPGGVKDTVAQVVKTGFTFKGRVIRPAQVGVFLGAK